MSRKGAAATRMLAPLAVLIALATPASAQREDQGLQLNCANDFFRLCAGVDPNSPDADNCMNRNRPRLSRECRAAIGDYNKRSGGKARGAPGEDD